MSVVEDDDSDWETDHSEAQCDDSDMELLENERRYISPGMKKLEKTLKREHQEQI